MGNLSVKLGKRRIKYQNITTMKIANRNDKSKVVRILTSSFLDNKSINYIIPSDSSRINRINELMSYSFETCLASGKVLLSDDELACALISFPEKKKTTFISLFHELRLVIFGMGFKNVMKAIKREKLISAQYPHTPIYYLWFLGVDPDYQSKGIGSKLLMEILNDAKSEDKPVFLETSTFKNISWYNHFGLRVYRELDFGYTLYLISNSQ